MEGFNCCSLNAWTLSFTHISVHVVQLFQSFKDAVPGSAHVCLFCFALDSEFPLANYKKWRALIIDRRYNYM